MDAARGDAGDGGARPRRRRARARAAAAHRASACARDAAAHGAPLARPRRRDARRRRQAPAPAARPARRRRAAGAGQDDALVRAGAAVELVHMATLVHDDVLDAAALRRGRPTVVAAAGRDVADRDRRPALLARLRRARRRTATPTQVARALATPRSALARGELLQRADACDAGDHRSSATCGAAS